MGIRILALPVVIMATFVAALSAQAEGIRASEQKACDVFATASCPLSQMLEMRSLVWAVRCDGGKSVIAKYRVQEKETILVFWTKLATSPDPTITQDGAVASITAPRTGFARSINADRMRIITTNEFSAQMTSEAPGVLLFLDRSKRASSGCANLRVNTTE